MSLGEKSICSLSKTWLHTFWETLVGNQSFKSCLVVGQRVCTHPRRVSGSLLSTSFTVHPEHVLNLFHIFFMLQTYYKNYLLQIKKGMLKIKYMHTLSLTHTHMFLKLFYIILLSVHIAYQVGCLNLLYVAWTVIIICKPYPSTVSFTDEF